MGEVPLQLKIGGIHANIDSVTRSPDMKRALAGLLRAVADEIDGGVHGEDTDQVEPGGSPEDAPG